MSFLINPYRHGGDPVSPPDPHIANVVALLHFNNNLVDVKGHTFSNSGTSSALSSAQAKFGGYSLSIAGTGAAGVSSSWSADWDLSTSSFTVEAWVYRSAIAAGPSYCLMGPWSAGNRAWLIYATSAKLEFINASFTAHALAYDWTANLNRWVHVAFARAATTMRGFIDGTQIGSSATYNNWSNVGTTPLLFGQNGSDAQFWGPGYVDDVRITKGVARYTANFTPPNAPFSDV